MRFSGAELAVLCQHSRTRGHQLRSHLRARSCKKRSSGVKKVANTPPQCTGQPKRATASSYLLQWGWRFHHCETRLANERQQHHFQVGVSEHSGQLVGRLEFTTREKRNRHTTVRLPLSRRVEQSVTQQQRTGSLRLWTRINLWPARFV